MLTFPTSTHIFLTSFPPLHQNDFYIDSWMKTTFTIIEVSCEDYGDH